VEPQLKEEPDQDQSAVGRQTDCIAKGSNCFLPRTAFKSSNGHLLLVDHLVAGHEVLAVDGAPRRVLTVHRLEKAKCHVVELVTRLGSFKVSACHRVIVPGQDGATPREKKAADLAIGDRVLMGTRDLDLTNVKHLEMWTELFRISFDQDAAVEGFITPLFGMQTLGDPCQAGASSHQEPGSVFDLSGLPQYSEEDLRGALPLRYED